MEGGEKMRTVQRLLLVLLLIICSSQAASAADGMATLGEDPRPYAVILSSNVQKIPDVSNWVSGQFGFAYMQDVQKGSSQTDYCYTQPRAGSSATLKALDGVASPENAEPIVRTVGYPSANAVKYEGRTGDCYYLVMGTYAGGTGGSGGETSHWYSEFDTNQNPASPHFVLTINGRYSSIDDRIELGYGSFPITVELQNSGHNPGEIYFRLFQTPLDAVEFSGAVSFVDGDGATSGVHAVNNTSQEMVFAVGSASGMVSLIAMQTDSLAICSVKRLTSPQEQ